MPDPPSRTRSLSRSGNKGVYCEDRCLCRENLLGENTMNFLICVETGVLEDDTPEIQVGTPA